MAPKYTLSYFNITGLGEPIRFLLAYGKEEWEDKRIEAEEWPKVKPTMPLGKMPVLEFDGQKYCQSVALARFLGKKYGLDGANDMENLKIDMALDTFTDMRLTVVMSYRDPDPERKAANVELLLNTTLPFYLGKLEEMVKENGGFLANGKLSWADLYVTSPWKYYSNLVGFDIYGKYPALKQLREKVESIPQIAAYIAKRPAGDK